MSAAVIIYDNSLLMSYYIQVVAGGLRWLTVLKVMTVNSEEEALIRKHSLRTCYV